MSLYSRLFISRQFILLLHYDTEDDAVRAIRLTVTSQIKISSPCGLCGGGGGGGLDRVGERR